MKERPEIVIPGFSRQRDHLDFFVISSSIAAVNCLLPSQGRNNGRFVEPRTQFPAESRNLLQADRFRELTKQGNLEDVLAGVFAAKKIGMKPIKLIAIITKETNHNEILELIEFARNKTMV